MNPPAVFALHLAVMTALHFGAPGPTWNLGATRWCGLPLVAAGMALVLPSAARFRGRTTIRPFEASTELVTTGAFRWSRNPMYLGLVTCTLGAFVMYGTLAPGIAVPSLAWILQKRFIEGEEAHLEAQFGETYRAYKERVRRWL